MSRPVPATDQPGNAARRRWASALVAAACALGLLAGCAVPHRPGDGPAPAGALPPRTSSSLGNFPDPFVLAHGGAWLAYATNGQGRHVQLARSTDLRHWQALPDAMPQLAAWVQPGRTWAPEVLQLAGGWRLYYTARHRASGRQCIGVASADSPLGPFVDSSPQPLVCQLAAGGSIDPSPVRDAARLVLLYKNDGNCCGLPTAIYAQALRADGLALEGAPVLLLAATGSGWEGAVVEAPSMVRRGDRWGLFYSANDYGHAGYAVGYAECAALLGPCHRVGAQPVLASRLDDDPPLIGPGHQAPFEVGGQTWLAYHAWQVGPDGRRGAARFLHIDRIDWLAGRPLVAGPTRVP